jgi:hypothetical protein
VFRGLPKIILHPVASILIILATAGLAAGIHSEMFKTTFLFSYYFFLYSHEATILSFRFCVFVENFAENKLWGLHAENFLFRPGEVWA